MSVSRQIVNCLLDSVRSAELGTEYLVLYCRSHPRSCMMVRNRIKRFNPICKMDFCKKKPRQRIMEAADKKKKHEKNITQIIAGTEHVDQES